MNNFIQNIRMWLMDKWMSLSDTTREKIISAWHTFVTVFFTVAVVTVQNGHIEWTWAFWSSVVTVALRMAWKAAWTIIMPPSVGGTRQ